MDSKDAYLHVGETFRYFLNWRHLLFGGYLGVLGALCLAFAWAHTPLADSGKQTMTSPLQLQARRALPFAAIALSTVFWMMDFRNRDLWRGCIFVGRDLEERILKERGVYTHLHDIGNRETTGGISHGRAIDLLVSVVIATVVAQVTDQDMLRFPPVILGIMVFVALFPISVALGNAAQSARVQQEEEVRKSANGSNGGAGGSLTR